MTVQDMANHAFSFFFGGFDTVASQTCIVAHLLAENPDVQERLQQEIDETLENNNGEVTDAMQEMKYLDAVINETLRLYSVTTFLDGMCVKDFELPPARPGNKLFTVKAGMNIWVPVIAIHQDPKYYPSKMNPKFDPDRFFENKTITNSGAYMPFGLGPRMCIGNRLALLEMKVLLCHVLAKCSIKLAPKTITSLQFEKGVFNITRKNGFWLAIEPRDSNCFSTVSASAVSCN